MLNLSTDGVVEPLVAWLFLHLVPHSEIHNLLMLTSHYSVWTTIFTNKNFFWDPRCVARQSLINPESASKVPMSPRMLPPENKEAHFKIQSSR